jgi:Fur family ferric uptake transcriptional regulator
MNSLNRSGLKNTKARAAILKILQQSNCPLSAEEIYDGLVKCNIHVNASTVYRALTALCDKKLIGKTNVTGDKKSFFEYNAKGHRHYLICSECKKIITIERCPLRAYEKMLELETNFTISGHKLSIYGSCPECKGK